MTSTLFLLRTVLMKTIQMQLSKKQNTFSIFFSSFLEFKLNFEPFGKKADLYSLCILEITDY